MFFISGRTLTRIASGENDSKRRNLSFFLEENRGPGPDADPYPKLLSFFFYTHPDTWFLKNVNPGIISDAVWSVPTAIKLEDPTITRPGLSGTRIFSASTPLSLSSIFLFVKIGPPKKKRIYLFMAKDYVRICFFSRKI